MNRRHAPIARCGLVWFAACVGLAALTAWVLPDLADARSALAGPGLAAQPFEQLLLWLVAAAALVGATWLWVVTTAVTIEAVRGAGGTPGVPPVVRRIVLAACGVALGSAVVLPAGATPGNLHLDEGGSPQLAAISGLPLPDRATGPIRSVGHMGQRLATSPTPRPVRPTVAGLVEVRPGDTLWGIAQAQLGPETDAAAIERQWRRIYDANRGVIGPDPDLVQPGQQLRLPRS